MAAPIYPQSGIKSIFNPKLITEVIIMTAAIIFVLFIRFNPVSDTSFNIPNKIAKEITGTMVKASQ